MNLSDGTAEGIYVPTLDIQRIRNLPIADPEDD